MRNVKDKEKIENGWKGIEGELQAMLDLVKKENEDGSPKEQDPQV